MKISSKRRVCRDDAFIEAAMRAHGASVWRLALVHVSTWQDAEDIYQDVFIRLAMCPTVFATDEHLKAWLLRVALNCCHDLARARGRRGVVSLDDIAFDPAGPDDPEASLVCLEETARLMDAVKRLPHKQRAVVHLFYGEQLTCDEIASALNVRPSTVRMRLKRARDRLKLQLGGASCDRLQSLSLGTAIL